MDRSAGAAGICAAARADGACAGNEVTAPLTAVVDDPELLPHRWREGLARAARRPLARADAAGSLDKDAAKVLLDVQKRQEIL